MSQTVYIVTSGSYSDYRIDRVYLDRDEAYKYVEARQGAYYSETNDVEEYEVWEPREDFFEGRIWEGIWRPAQQLKERKQTLIDVPIWVGGRVAVQKMFVWDAPQEYETVDNFDFREVWHVGSPPPRAVVHQRPTEPNPKYPYVAVRGHSKGHVEKTLYDTVAEVKAGLAGIS